MRISKIKFDSNKVKNFQEFEINNVTVLVGPHNSGKSQTLKDIDNWFWNHQENIKIIKGVEFDLPSDQKSIEELLKEFLIETPEGESNNPNIIYLRPPYSPINKSHDKINLDWLTRVFAEKRIAEIRNSTLNLITYFHTILDGKTRFSLIEDKPRGNMNSFPLNHLDSLYRKDNVRKYLRKIIYEEFGWYFYLSPLKGPNLTIVMHRNPDLNERSLDNETIQQFKGYEELSDFGDGIKCFIGILVSILAYSRRIILLDEPEAFLHPSASRSLGRHLSQITEERNSSLIVATHSADFLMGCLEATEKMTILRLNYDYNLGTVTQLDSNDIKVLSSDPILRSTDSLSALFHKSAIICEAEKDKVLYHAINRKLLSNNIGINDNIFLNVNGKDAIYKLVAPLRKTGMPAACVYDLDVMKIDAKNKIKRTGLWKNIFSAINVDDMTRKELEEHLSKINDLLESQPGEQITLNIKSVDSNNAALIEAFIEKLSHYGVFIVPVGELEDWFPSFQNDESWLTNALNWIETNNPDDDPSSKCIWIFMQKIKKWVECPSRKGMRLD